MVDLKLGINLWAQASDWPAFLDAGTGAERLGYDYLWTWDHLYAIFGDPHQPIFEGIPRSWRSPRQPIGSGWVSSWARTPFGIPDSRRSASRPSTTSAGAAR
jgi:hypothetical protein